MVKELLKPLKHAIEKQEAKRKKLEDKKKKLKVTYDKKRDVYIIKMKGKKYLLKRKEPVRKLRTRKAKDALKEHLKNLSKTKAAPVGQVSPPENSGNSLPASRSQPNLKKNQNVSPQATPDALAIPDAQAKYQMFAGYNQAEQLGQKQLQDAAGETAKAKAAQAAAEEQLRSHLVNPELPALLPAEYEEAPAAGIRRRLPYEPG